MYIRNDLSFFFWKFMGALNEVVGRRMQPASTKFLSFLINSSSLDGIMR